MAELEEFSKLPDVHQSPHSSAQGLSAIAKGARLADVMVWQV